MAHSRRAAPNRSRGPVHSSSGPLAREEYGESLHPDVQAYAAFSYFDNLMTNASRERLDDLGEFMTVTTGLPWVFSGRDRAFAFSAGAKFLIPSSATVRPYIGGGAGLINLKRTIVDRHYGELTEEFLGQFPAGDGVFDAGELNATKPLGEGTVGVAIVAGRTYVDIGYRIRRVFHATEDLTFGQLALGVGMTF